MAKSSETKTKKAAPSKKSTGEKKPNPYQDYMKRELKVIKSKNPGMAHKEAFTQVAKNWKNSPENPANKK